MLVCVLHEQFQVDFTDEKEARMEAKSGMLPKYVGSGQAGLTVALLMSVAARITQSLIYSSEPQSGFSIGGCSEQLLTKHSRG